jgi:hypothetical protein
MNQIISQYLCRALTAVVIVAMLSSCDHEDPSSPSTPPDESGEITITIPGLTASNGDFGTLQDLVAFIVATDIDASKVELKLDGSPYSPNTGTFLAFTINTSELEDGKHILEAHLVTHSGKEFTAKVTFSISNTLVEIDVPADILSKHADQNPRGFVFLSDTLGKTLVAKEYTPGETLKLKAPAGFKSKKFLLTEVIAYQAGAFNSKVTTYSDIKRGTRWTLTSDNGDITDNVPFPAWPARKSAGTAQLQFVNIPAPTVGGYTLRTNGFLKNVASLSSPAAVDIAPTTTSMTDLMISSSSGEIVDYEGNSVQDRYVWVPAVSANTNRALDLSQAQYGGFTREDFSGNFTGRLNIDVYGLRFPDSFDNAILTGWSYPTSSNTYKLLVPYSLYPRFYYLTTNKAYYEPVYNLPGDHVDFVNATRDGYIKMPGPTMTEVSASIFGDRTVRAERFEGDADMFYITIYNGHISWRVMGAPYYIDYSKPQDRRWDDGLIFMPEIPSILQGLIDDNFVRTETIMWVHALDVNGVNGYTAFLDLLRQGSDGFNSAIGFGTEWRYRQQLRYNRGRI